MPTVTEQVQAVNANIKGTENAAMQTVASTAAPVPPTSTYSAAPSVSTEDLASPVTPVTQPAPTYPSLAGIYSSAENRLATTKSELDGQKANNSALTDRILGLQNELQGSAAYQAQLEQDAQLSERRTKLRQMSSNITSSLADLQAFDAETENMLEQYRGQGNGVAANIIDRKNTERRRLRNLDKITQAASLGRQVAAADLLSGDIETAQANIDRAVEAEFAPVRQQIETAKWLLERSDAGLDRLTDAEIAEYSNFVQSAEAFITDKKQTERDIMAVADEAIRNGAPQQLVNQILSSQSPQDAQSVASPYIGLLDRQQATASINASNASAANSWANYEATQMEMAQMRQAQADRQAAIESGQLLPEQAEVADTIDNQFRAEPIVKEYNEAVGKRYAVEEILNNGVNGVQDLLLVYEFMKAVDPTSVVRESEFDNAAKTGNIFAGKYTKFNQGYFGEGGILPADVKQSFTNSLNASWDGKQAQYFNVKSEFGDKVNRRLGIDDGEQYLTSYEDAAPLDSTDRDVAAVLSGASAQDAQDIMIMVERMLNGNEIGR